MSAEPTKTEVLAWLERTARSIPEALREFWPDVTDEYERERILSRLRKWRSREKRRAARPPRQPGPELRLVRRDDPPVATAPETQADEAEAIDLATMTASEQATWQLGQVTRLHRKAARRNDARSVVLLDQRLSALRAELDEARKREGVGAAPLEPVPASVALDLVRADKQIADLAALLEAVQQQAEEVSQ